MELVTAVFVALFSVVSTILVQRFQRKRKQKKIKQEYFSKVVKDVKSELNVHSAEFGKKEVLKVGDNVYVAIGYGLANSILIEGDTGVVIIDTLESCEVAREVREEFSKITSKPVVGIVLTHFHADHAHGTEEFLKGSQPGEVKIFAHDSFPLYFSQVIDVRGPITFMRAARQFGTEIPEDVKLNSGIGLNLKLDGSSTHSYVYPTHTFSDRLTVSLAGLQLELIHAPGETNDQIVVWYPAKRTLFPADNIYKAFPNLYAIRGCMHRDTLQWVAALDIMLDLEPDLLVPQHTRPLFGKDVVSETLTAYRDAIQLVHDQTVRYMNKGLSDREIVSKVSLPPHLASHPYLKEFYGTVEWSVRAVYHGYLGWFSGRPADLHPLPREEEAGLMVDLAGGPQAMLVRAEEAVAKGNFQWGLQLTDSLVDSQQDSQAVRDLRGRCLRSLAGREVSANGMNWYLTEDLVQQGLQIKPSQRQISQRIMTGSMRSLFTLLTCMLDCEATVSVTCSAVFRFSDTGEEVVVVVRRGIAFLPTTSPTDPDLTVDTTSLVWRQVLAKERTAVVASLAGEIRVTPGVQALATFFSYFDTDR